MVVGYIKEKFKTLREASNSMGVPRTTIVDYLSGVYALYPEMKVAPMRQAPSKFATRTSLAGDTGFQVAELPNPDEPISELLERRKRQFARSDVAERSRKLTDVNVKMDGPIGIVHFGDPHVDDDGTDIALIEEHLNIVNSTEGLFGANLGDLQNNWVGRLSHLWANQSTSKSEAWRLTEWMVRSTPWLYLIGGNHDAWSGVGDPLQWILRDTNTAFSYHGVRINLKFPSGKEVRVNARHDFSGHSMWNPAHGPMKAVQGGWRDHILTCGHKHVSFIGGPLKDPSTGLLSWSIRCAGYKIHDSYAIEKGLPDQNAFPACVTIIDPYYADDDTKLITVVPDVKEGAEFLKWKRGMWAKSQRSIILPTKKARKR